MCPNRTLSSPLLLSMTMDSIVPSWRILICACPWDSDAHAGTSISERSWVLNTIGGASSLATLLRDHKQHAHRRELQQPGRCKLGTHQREPEGVQDSLPHGQCRSQKADDEENPAEYAAPIAGHATS